MRWTVNYFQMHKREWDARRDEVSEAGLYGDGLRCYAAKQAAMWGKLASVAEDTFKPYR